ncbi:MAG: Spy/CpxP family protein refolding chaperone [Sulfurifustaceae bacterium]
MVERHTLLFRGLVAAIVAGAWMLSAQAADSTADKKPPTAESTAKKPTDNKPANDPAAQLERLRKQTEKRLALMKDELGISGSQETAWGAYAQTVLNLAGSKLTPPAAVGDAAGVVRFRAQQAAENADKLNQLADATTKLEQALTPEQRKTLYQMVQPPSGPHGGMH